MYKVRGEEGGEGAQKGRSKRGRLGCNPVYERKGEEAEEKGEHRWMVIWNRKGRGRNDGKGTEDKCAFNRPKWVWRAGGVRARE